MGMYPCGILSDIIIMTKSVMDDTDLWLLRHVGNHSYYNTGHCCHYFTAFSTLRSRPYNVNGIKSTPQISVTVGSMWTVHLHRILPG